MNTLIIISVCLIIVSTVLLTLLPVSLDAKISKCEKELGQIDSDINIVLNDIKVAGLAGQNFTILQNQFKTLQEINSKSNQLQFLFQDLITTKVQITSSALNSVQKTSIITQGDYNKINLQLNEPFDLSTPEKSFKKLHDIHQGLFKKIESGLELLVTQKEKKEVILSKQKRNKKRIIQVAIIFNSISILIGAYITIKKNNDNIIEQNIKAIEKVISNNDKKTRESINLIDRKIDSLINKDKNGINERKENK
jgi:hypothetical protein